MTPPIVTVEIALEAVNDVMRSSGGAANVTPDATFEELGLDSLDFSELLVALETRVGMALDTARAGEVKRVRDLILLRPLEQVV